MTTHGSIEPHLYIHTPTPAFKARINMPAVTYPVTALTFDTVTLGAYTDLAFDMTMVLGTADGLDDLGRVRVQKLATSTTIPIGRVARGVEDGHLEVIDNAFITVYADDFRVWAKIPVQDLEGVDYKDSDVPVGDFLTEIPPVVVMGGGFADYIDPVTGKVVVGFDGSGSYAMADGATIVTFAWDTGGGTVVAGDLDEASITLEFTPGLYIVALTVTDSNGVPNTSRRPVLAVDPANDVTIGAAEIEGSQRFTQQGQSIAFRIPVELPRSLYPDGTLVMYWWGKPSDPADRSHMKFVGWEQSSEGSSRATKPGLVRETTINCVDAAGRLDSLPGFPQALQREDDPEVDEQWSLMPSLTMHKCLHYLLFWHSTALAVADLIMPDSLRDYPSMRLDSAGSSLYDQVSSMAGMVEPDHLFCCNSQGQLVVLEDWMLIDVGDRPTVAHILTEDDYGELTVSYSRSPKVYALRGGAIVCSTEWLMLGGEKTLPLVFCVAPHTDSGAFGQGMREEQDNEGLTQSQEQLNVTKGHKYARLNARFGTPRVTLLDPSAIWDFEPALLNRVQLNIAAEYAAQRGLPFTQVNCMVKELTVTPRATKQGLAIEATATLEFETSGPPAITHIPEVEGQPDDYETPPPPPPTEPPPGLTDGVELVAGIGLDGNVYVTTDFQTPSGSGGPTWTSHSLGISPTIYSWVVDPFSPGYIEGAGAINGWIACDDGIYRVEDLFGTPNATLVHAFFEATVGASFHWRSIQASFGAYFAPGANPWLICVSYYGDISGHEGTWATYSTDGGVTWSDEVQLSADFSTGDSRFNPIGLYLSPKTPGLGYTVARGENLTEGMPHFVYFSTSGVLSDLGAMSGYNFNIQRIDNTTGDGGVSGVEHVMIAPPTGTARIDITVHWSVTKQTNASGSVASTVTVVSVPSVVDHTTDNDYDDGSATADETLQGAFGIQALLDTPFVSNNWPGTIPQIGTAAADVVGEFGIGLEFNFAATAIGGAPPLASIIATFGITINEIELEDGTVYTFGAAPSVLKKTTNWGAAWATDTFLDPGSANAGTIHFPWPNNADEQVAYHGHFDASSGNREFGLMRVQGGVATDISPNDGSRNYGVNRGHFGVRTFDGNRQYVLAAVVGNDTSNDPDDDMHAVYASDDYGDTWAEVVAPIADSSAPMGRPAFEAAFGGESEQVIFIWGPLGYISYSDDFGATVDDRSGNLGGTVAFVGIAGGPTG